MNRRKCPGRASFKKEAGLVAEMRLIQATPKEETYVTRI
jgi:hypothetical protein